MVTYEKKETNQNDVYLQEQNLFGSQRMGIQARDLNLTTPPVTTANIFERTLGDKQFELGNHLGNVLSVVSDLKIPISPGGSTIDYYQAKIESASDYYAFGGKMPGRGINGSYRYGFNGKEKDDEVKGSGNSVDFGDRIYDPRLGRWLSVDGRFKDYVPFSPYNFALNNPIYFKDADGNVVVDKDGRPVTVSITKAKDGTASATYIFSKNATQAAKDEFMVNGARVINAMLPIKSGSQVVEDMSSSKNRIHLNVSPETTKAGAGYQAGYTDVKKTTTKNGEGKVIKEVYNTEVTIYEGSINTITEKGFSEYKDNELNQEQKVGREGVHEGIHATKDYKILGAGKKLTEDEHKGAKDGGSTAAKEYGNLNKK